MISFGGDIIFSRFVLAKICKCYISMDIGVSDMNPRCKLGKQSTLFKMVSSEFSYVM
jgi:hypothetical protein